MEIQPCVRCGRALKAPQGITTTGDKAIAIYIYAVSVGIRPRLVSKARRMPICLPCVAAIAMAPPPDNGAFNSTVYEILDDLNRRGMTIIQAAWEQKTNPHARPQLMPGSRPDETLVSAVVNAPMLTAAS
jgi:hypothetical protein